MKIGIMKKATIFLIAVTIVLSTVVSAMAVSYYQAGEAGFSATTNTIQFYYLGPAGGKFQALKFSDNPVTDPVESGLKGILQSISGYYKISKSITEDNVWNLASVTQQGAAAGPSEITVDSYVYALATATQIRFNDENPELGTGTGTISWDVDSVTVDQTGLAGDLTGLANASSYAYSTVFQNSTTLQAWLDGTGTIQTPRYYARMEGFAAAPEPGEWMLMFIGLGMLGFYLQRRGYLNFDISPQSVG